MLREPMPAAVTYLSLGAFYGADPVRRTSRERDLGLWWRTPGQGPTYRAAWVQDTGEIYLVQHGLTGHGSGHVEVLAHIPHPDRLEALLAGWRDEVGKPGSLRWLRERLEGGSVREWPLPTGPAPAAA